MYTMAATLSLAIVIILYSQQYCGMCSTTRYGEIDVALYREKVKRMFYHAYEGYLNHAYPYDELQPLTCGGHDTWGSYSLTLIDAMDTLAVMGNYSEFRRIAHILIDKGESFFDIDINASVFETNIRIVGGLISGHLLMKRAGMVLEPAWPCSGPLLRMADNIARKILPAFDTPTGMPYGTVNLRHGVPKGETTVTCTAGIGTFLIEFGTLSRLTGDPIFEKTAIRAIRALWKFRSPLGLLGNHIDVSNGKWTAMDSGIGGGIDSYFEYLVKGAIMFNIPELLHMFREYEVAIKKYVKKDDWYMWAQMNKGGITLPLFTSLDGFWPGIQAMLGDLNQAMKTMHNFHQVWRQFGFTPEYYNIPKAEAHQGREGYPLRPEVIESAMYLYRATKDPYLLEIGVDIVETIEHSARTSCGYATVKDVRDHRLEDRMESFFLAETTKYLYLLFDPENFIHNNGSSGDLIHTPGGSCVTEAGGYIFNTEAHPIDLAAVHCCSAVKKEEDRLLQDFHNNLDIVTLLNLFDSDDSIWSVKKEAAKKRKSQKRSQGANRVTQAMGSSPTMSGIGDLEVGQDLDSESLWGLEDEEFKIWSDKDYENDDGVNVDDGSERKRHLEVIDMTTFTEMERNFTHDFMKELQIQSILKHLSGQIAQKLKQQYKATAYELLANDVAGKILKAGEDQSQTLSENTTDVGTLPVQSTDKGSFSEQSADRGTSTEPSTDEGALMEQSTDGRIPVDMKPAEQEHPKQDNVALKDVSVVENKISQDHTTLAEQPATVSADQPATVSADQLATVSEPEANTASPKQDHVIVQNDLNKDSTSPHTVKITHQISIEANGNNVVIVHVPKNKDGEESNSLSDSASHTVDQSEASENTKELNEVTERFKSHIDLQIQQDDQKTEDHENSALRALSPPGTDKTPSPLEMKRNNLLSLTNKLLNIFSGQKEESGKSDEPFEARVPSLSGLYISMANYTLHYFHDPASMHCPSQTFHSRFFVYGETFEEN
ncbi:unnamed protein product [Lymnaea stagnalis]|uniref:alpha-1,2-Mannosidase n=1 Tax=Lymnaea stagnalis TaxID=6523 RepID=A0AAV2HPY0_LYMST